MAACNATTLITSVILGVIVFQETISRGQGLFSPAIIGLTLAVIGLPPIDRKQGEPIAG
jgi:hypothetical protein